MNKNVKKFYGWISLTRAHKLVFFTTGLFATTHVMADEAYLLIYRNSNSSGSSYSNNYGRVQDRDSDLKQPKIRWYRYYDSNGQASLSNTLTEEQMKYGYEALDKNMQVVKRVAPYTAEKYAIQKAQQDAAQARKNADLELKKAYNSSTAAAAKRDQILADLTGRRSYLSTQLAGLQATLSNNIAQAATLERQQKPIPPMLKKNLEESRRNVNEAEKNIAAIDDRQKQVKAEYEQIIQRLSALEHGQ